ncbi:MAG TPA: hypothetical protein VK589_16170 [Chryseolinea sp.]|nr:hypothetical protein [Chryseolinea sp.]
MPANTYQLINTPGRPTVALRELNGFDELMTEGNGTRAVLNLLRNVVVSYSSESIPAPEKIVISDRDYLLSGIYRNAYGSRIQSVLKCHTCTTPFDMDFSLDDLVSSVRGSISEHPCDEEGFYLNDDCRFRLPDGEDELAVAGLPLGDAEKSILDRCIYTRGSVMEQADVQLLMKAVAPLLFNEMQVVCPECGEQQTVVFDIQTFLLTRMKNERKRVAAEVHSIAAAYHWSHREILEIPRRLRKTYAGMIGLE